MLALVSQWLTRHQALAERLFEIWTDGSMPMRERKERLGYFVDSQTAGDY